MKNKLPKYQGGGGKVLKNLIRKSIPNKVERFRNFNPGVDIRAHVGSGDYNFSGDVAIPELGLTAGDFSNLTNYERQALFNLGKADNLPDPRFNNLLRNFKEFNDNQIGHELGNFASDYPDSYFEVMLPKGKKSALMAEIFRDIPNVHNARHPFTTEDYKAEIEAAGGYGNYGHYKLKRRDNFTGEFEKNLRSYGDHGFYANNIPTMGASSYTPTHIPLNSELKKREYYADKSSDLTHLSSIKKSPYAWTLDHPKREGFTQYYLDQTPGYSFMNQVSPTAHYMRTASTMNPDPIVNIAKYRGRGEMDNQHNFLLGQTNSPSMIISGDQGFANLEGGNSKRINFNNQGRAVAGKYVDDRLIETTPLLQEKFNINSPIDGTFMKFPATQTFERTNSGQYVPSVLSYENRYKGYTDQRPTSNLLYRADFDIKNPFAQRPYLTKDGSQFFDGDQFWDSWQYPKSLLRTLFEREDGGPALPKAQFGKGLAKIFNPKALVQSFNRTNKSLIGKTPLNWGNVNESILDNKILLQEYKLIEEATKANGTWMKNADGSAFTGPPELFIQTKSSNFLDAYPDGYQTVWRGMEGPSSNLLNNVPVSVVDGDGSKMITGTGVFTGNEDLAKRYIGINENSPLYQLAMRNSNNSIEIPGLGSDWLNITNPYMKKKESLIRELELNKKGLENARLAKAHGNTQYTDDFFYNSERRINELANVILNYDFIKTDPKYSELAKWWDNPATRVGGAYSEEVNKLLGKTERDISTDDLGIYLQQTGLDNIRIPNITDGGRGDVFINNQVPGNYLKSLTENDGMFDLTKPSQFEKDGGELIKHTIVRGDTGKTLFEKYGVTASDIKEHNNIKFFAEGREIEIPSRELPKAQDGTETQSFRELHDESGNVIMSREELDKWRSPGGYTYKQLADYNNNIAKYTPREGINLQDKTTWEGKNYGSPFNSSNYDLFSNNEWNPQSQSDAYRMNRDMGNSSFFYQGKPYTTESKEELENRTPSQKLLDFNNNIAQIAQDKGLYGESLQNYINEMFPEGSRERNLLDMYEADSGEGFYTSYIEDNKDDMYMRSLYRDLENATSDGPEASNTLLEQEAIMNEIEARKKKMSKKAADMYQGPDIGDINIDQGTITQGYPDIPYNARFLYSAAPGLVGNDAAQRRFAVENPASPTNALAMAGMAAPILGGVGAVSRIPLGARFVVGDLINAGFAYNALSNTLPQAATDFYDGNYLDALGNATIGGLELMGAPTTFMKGYRGLQNNVNLFPKLNTQKAVNSLVPNSKLLNDYGLSQTKNLSLNARDLPAWSFSGRPNQLQARNYFRNNFNPADNTLINALP